MLRPRLVSTLALLLVLAAPSFGAAATLAGPRPAEPAGRLAAALSELRDLVATLWPPLTGGPVHVFGDSGGTAGELDGEGQESNDPGVQGSQDPNGAQTPPAEG
jgi:hypothetical protein